MSAKGWVRSLIALATGDSYLPIAILQPDTAAHSKSAAD